MNAQTQTDLTGHAESRGQSELSELPASPATSPETRPPAPPVARGKAATIAVFPTDLPTGVPLEVPFASGRPLRVTHAESGIDHALIYLHGMCGDPAGADPWADVALRRGTLIVVRPTVPCPDRPGYKWPPETEFIESQISDALKVVKEERGGVLDTEKVTLIGYSQGANRAEKVAGLRPDRYPYLILGGTPSLAEPARFSGAISTAFLGGELEDASHMQASAELVAASGKRSKFFLLPGAHHGDYGPRGRVVMTDVFAWLYADPPQGRSQPYGPSQP